MEDASPLTGVCHFSLPGGHLGSFTCGLELTLGLSFPSEVAARSSLTSLHSFQAFLFHSGLWGGAHPLFFAKKKNQKKICLKCFHIKKLFQVFNYVFFLSKTKGLNRGDLVQGSSLKIGERTNSFLLEIFIWVTYKLLSPEQLSPKQSHALPSWGIQNAIRFSFFSSHRSF